MGAKIVLSGQTTEIEKTTDYVSFTIHTGPATRRPPRGLELYESTRYRVTCTTSLWDRAHKVPDDPSDMLVEGYLEPRRDPESGELYVAVVATAIQSTLPHNRRRLEKLQQTLDEAREDFRRASEQGASKKVTQARAAAFVKANDRVKRFLERHPELKPPEKEADPEATDEG
jgi:hypothetical protein